MPKQSKPKLTTLMYTSRKKTVGVLCITFSLPVYFPSFSLSVVRLSPPPLALLCGTWSSTCFLCFTTQEVLTEIDHPFRQRARLTIFLVFVRWCIPCLVYSLLVFPCLPAQARAAKTVVYQDVPRSNVYRFRPSPFTPPQPPPTQGLRVTKKSGGHPDQVRKKLEKQSSL